jgi:hypothetical protein
MEVVDDGEPALFRVRELADGRVLALGSGLLLGLFPPPGGGMALPENGLWLIIGI